MQSAPTPIRQANLCTVVGNEIRRMIFDGRLGEGERLNEVRLATALGVSRTPLREALAALEAEGAVRREPRRGYFVRPLTLEEFDHLYPIRGLLDPEALRLAGIPDAGTLDLLDALNDRIEAAVDVDERIDLDDRWHLTLVRACPNPVLLDLIRDFMRRTRRYELAYLHSRPAAAAASDEHRAVTAALRAGDLDAAGHALRRNLTGGVAPIRRWLEERETRC